MHPRGEVGGGCQSAYYIDHGRARQTKHVVCTPEIKVVYLLARADSAAVAAAAVAAAAAAAGKGTALCPPTF